MDALFTILLPFVLLGLLIVGIQSNVLWHLASRPLLTLTGSMVAGIIYSRLGGPLPDPALTRAAARFGLAMLVFFAAQQIRISRLWSVSPAAFRLALWSPPLLLIALVVITLVFTSSISPWSAALLGGAIVLGGGPSIAMSRLAAPIEEQTRCAARVEAASALTVMAPIVLLLEAGISGSSFDVAFHRHPIFVHVAGFTVGGTLGLLLGRFVPLPNALRPVFPFLVPLLAYFLAFLMGFDVVMSVIAAGLLYSEEVKLPGKVRTAIWLAGERVLMPITLVAFGIVCADYFLVLDSITVILAVLAISVIRIPIRYLLVKFLPIPAPDQQFLSWAGGLPGIGSALFLMSLPGSPVASIGETVMAIGCIAVFLGLAFNRLGGKPLTNRLAHQTDRASKRRFQTA